MGDMPVALNETQNNVCKLISAAMFRRNESFSDTTDWEAVYNEMRAQTSQGLVLDILPELSISDALKKVWRSDCYQTIKTGIKLRYEQGELLSLFEKAGIPYVILKGTAAAMYYPNPMLRGMGDIDVYIPLPYHEEVRELLNSNGYALKEKKNQYRKKYIRHITYYKDGIEFEIHRAFAMINSAKERMFVDSLLEQCCRDDSKTIRNSQGDSSFLAPQTNVNGIVLLEHIGQHMLDGLGLRQITDWMMFVNASLHDSEWISFRKLAQEAGLEKLAKTVTKMCVKYFGLQGSYDWCMDADDKNVEKILTYLFESGNFGTKFGEASQVVAVTTHFKRSTNYFSTLQATGEYNWELYKKHHWLKPFAWLYQIFRYTGQALMSPNFMKKFIKGSSAVRRRFELMKSLGIYKKV